MANAGVDIGRSDKRLAYQHRVDPQLLEPGDVLWRAYAALADYELTVRDLRR